VAGDLRMEHRELRDASAIKDTLNTVRGRLATANGTVHLHFHSSYKHPIEQCKRAPWPSTLEEFHCLAALRYYCYELFDGEEKLGAVG
jgi:hypothetical protein